MKVLTWIVLAGFFLSGCAASKEEMAAYYKQIDSQTKAIIESIEQQGSDNTKARQSMMVHYTNAALNAAKTPDDTDDVLVAFAWGFQSAQSSEITIPKLPQPKQPKDSVDALKAWTPIIGMTIPFVTPLIYGWSGAFDGGTTYSAQDNGRINVNSKNAGSYNTAGGNQSITSTPTYQDENCLDCEGSGGEELPPDPAEATEPGGPTCEETGGYLGADGRLYANPDFTCSCKSRSAGAC